MMGRMSHIATVFIFAACMLAGCGSGGTGSGSDAPVGLTKKQQDDLSAKYRAETKKNITKDNAEKVLKDLEAEIGADEEK
jgi:hypothetical protein